jgi:hypothetical protein
MIQASRHLFALFIRAGGIFLLLYFFSCRGGNKPGEKKQYASLLDSTAYVGMETCKECHADKYETFIHTGMGLSFDVASPAKSAASFSPQALVVDSFRNLRYHPYWDRDSLKLLEFRLTGRDTVFRRTENISWIVGSGQHTNSHLWNANGYVYQAPATYYTQSRRWDLPPGFEGGFNSRFSRKIGLECMSCHNAYPKMVLGSENKYAFVANGIDCERCHGPGALHVQEKRAGNIVDINTAIDYSIVNPAKLPVDLQLDICQRCHIQGNAVLKPGKTFFDFRPGMSLQTVMDVYMPLYSGDEYGHIMASHAERMKQSKCFLVSTARAENPGTAKTGLRPYENSLTCVTCHDPHVSVRVTNDSVFNNKCISCHNTPMNGGTGASLSPVCGESVNERSKTGDNCVRCHMPRGGATDIPHVITTDHRIGIPIKKEAVKKIQDFAGLVCVNNPSPDSYSRAEAYLSFFEKFSGNTAYLDSARRYIGEGQTAGAASNFRQYIRWAYLKNDYTGVVNFVRSIPRVLDSLHRTSYTNEDAWTAYRIGESYVSLGDNSSAVTFFGRATELAPFVPDFRNKLAGAFFDVGKIAEARKEYYFLIRENPDFTSAYVSLGFLILSHEKNPVLAGEMYRRALALDPDNLQALLNMAGLKLYNGEVIAARFYLREVLKRDARNKQALYILRGLG